MSLLLRAAAGVAMLALAGCAGTPSLAPSAVPSVAASVLASVAPSAAGPSTAGSTAASAPASGGAGTATDTVNIANFAFDPASASVKAGGSITWSNNDSTTHTVTFDDGSDSSGNIATGATFKRTFTKAGTFTYHCSIHPFMKGTVVVGG